MKVRSKTDNREYEATKKTDGSYTVEGKTLSAEEMGKLYVPIKEKKVVEKKVMEVIESDSEIGGNIGGLAEALSKCQGEFTSVKKGSSGHGYDYADIEAVISSTSPITSKYGISIIQMNLSKQVGDVTMIGVKTIIAHSEGGYISSSIFTPIAKTKMNSLVQMAGVNITYLRRYGIQSALGLSTTDSDGSDK